MKYNIKRAGEYSNKLQRIIEKLSEEITYGENVEYYYYDITEVHKKSAIQKDYIDEIIKPKPEKIMINANVFEIVKLIDNMLLEKIKIDNEISKAKKNITIYHPRIKKEISLDMILQENKMTREVVLSKLEKLINEKDVTMQKICEFNTVNLEGNMTTLQYTTEISKKIKYDIDETIEYYKKLLKELDNLSYEIDKKMTEEVFDFEPQFDIYDNIDNIMKKFKLTQK